MRANLISQDFINYYKIKSERIDIIPFILCIVGLFIWMLYYRYLSKNNNKIKFKII